MMCAQSGWSRNGRSPAGHVANLIRSLKEIDANSAFHGFNRGMLVDQCITESRPNWRLLRMELPPQATAGATKAQWREVSDQLRSTNPRLAKLMEFTEKDVLIYMSFPSQHWAKRHLNKPFEPLNVENKRRTELVDIFPNEGTITRPSFVDNARSSTADLPLKIHSNWQSTFAKRGAISPASKTTGHNKARYQRVNATIICLYAAEFRGNDHAIRVRLLQRDLMALTPTDAGRVGRIRLGRWLQR